MAHLSGPQQGWENERRAEYLLSRLSFVARPTSVADDLGSDFFCTIFEVGDLGGREVLLPRSSFAIQVKSPMGEVLADNKVEYLVRLEMPFFIGVVTQSPPTMTIYSADLLPLLFSEVGTPERLSLMPVDASDFDRNNYYERVGDTAVRLRCPRAVTLNVDDDRSSLTTKIRNLLGICSRARGNIAARVSEEHIYDLDGKGNWPIMAGTGSVQFFKHNLLKRLGEVFWNLLWIFQNQPPNQFPISEFQAFTSFYHELEIHYGRLPGYVSVPYHKLTAQLASRPE